MPSILWFVFCLVWTEHFLSPLCLKLIVTWQPCIMHLPHPYGVHTSYTGVSSSRHETWRRALPVITCTKVEFFHHTLVACSLHWWSLPVCEDGSIVVSARPSEMPSLEDLVAVVLCNVFIMESYSTGLWKCWRGHGVHPWIIRVWWRCLSEAAYCIKVRLGWS